ncbi:MAG: hypothetical protein FWD18_04645 [Micrococcales bacterium]|nr:hypothetical protein [Micrococcales bacterium]
MATPLPPDDPDQPETTPSPDASLSSDPAPAPVDPSSFPGLDDLATSRTETSAGVSPVEPFRLGWQAFTSAPDVLVGAILVWGLAFVPVGVVGAALIGLLDVNVRPDVFSTGVAGWRSTVLVALVALVWGLVQAAFARAALGMTRGDLPAFASLFRLAHAGPALAVSAIFAVAVLVLLLIPLVGWPLVLVAGLLALFAHHAVIADQARPVDAIWTSVRLVTDNSHVRTVVVFFLITLALLAATVLTCGIAFIVVGPWVLVSTAYLFARLRGQPLVVLTSPEEDEDDEDLL